MRNRKKSSILIGVVLLSALAMGLILSLNEVPQWAALIVMGVAVAIVVPVYLRMNRPQDDSDGNVAEK